MVTNKHNTYALKARVENVKMMNVKTQTPVVYMKVHTKEFDSIIKSSKLLLLIDIENERNIAVLTVPSKIFESISRNKINSKIKLSN